MKFRVGINGLEEVDFDDYTIGRFESVGTLRVETERFTKAIQIDSHPSRH